YWRALQQQALSKTSAINDAGSAFYRPIPLSDRFDKHHKKIAATVLGGIGFTVLSIAFPLTLALIAGFTGGLVVTSGFGLAVFGRKFHAHGQAGELEARTIHSGLGEAEHGGVKLVQSLKEASQTSVWNDSNQPPAAFTSVIAEAIQAFARALASPT